MTQRLTMVSNCNNQLMVLLCSFLFSFIHFSESNDQFIINAFDVSPKLKSLSNVNVWLDNKVTSLSEILGQNVNVWEIREDGAKEIARITSAALACNNAKKIYQIIQSVEYIAETCNKISNKQSARSCHDQLKQFFNDYGITVLDILCSTSYYAEYLKVRNKNFFMAVLGIHIIFNRDKSFDESPEGLLQYDRTTSYMRYSLETYTTEFCSPPTFDYVNFPLKNECIFPGENGLDDFIKCVRTFLEASISAEALDPSSLGHDEKVYKRDLFAINNLMMSELVDTELIQGADSSAMKHLLINFFFDEHVSLNTIREHVKNGHQPDNIVKYQALVIECMGSVMFYLISNIIETNIHLEGTSKADQVNEYIIRALKTLESLGSNNTLSWSLDNIKLKQIIRNDRRDMEEAITGFFSISNIKEKYVAMLFQTNQLTVKPSNEILLNKYIEILDKFIKSIEQFKPLIFVTTEIMNEQFNIIDEFEFKFVESFNTSDGHSQIVEENCEFALFLTKHFELSTALVSQCKDLTTKMINVDHTEIVECFSKVKKYSNKSIKTIFKQFYGEFIELVYEHRDGVYYKMIEAMYSLLLYFNNLEIFNVTNTEDSSLISFDYIQLKGDSIIRFYRTIANPLQLYINKFCNANEHHQVENKNLLLSIDYVIEQITLNNKTYTRDDYRDDDFDSEEDDDKDFSFADEDQWDDDDDDIDDDDDADADADADDEDDIDVDDDADADADDEDDSSSDEFHGYTYNTLGRFAETVSGRLDLRRFLFEDIVVKAITPGYCGSFINDVKVTWHDGRNLKVREIVEIVENQMHPQHVHACIIIIPRIVIFLVSEILLDIVEIIKKPDIKSINRKHANSIIKSLKTVFKFDDYFVFFFNYFKTMKYYLKRFSRLEVDTGSCDRLIGLIKTKQAELGVQLQDPNKYKTLIPSNTSNNPSTDVVNSLVESVEKLSIFAKNVKRVYKKIFYHRVFNTQKTLNDLTIM